VNTDHKATLSNMHADMLHARGWSAYPSVRDRDVNAAIDEDMAGSSLVLQVEWLVSACGGPAVGNGGRP
jgi:hypothetical protein